MIVRFFFALLALLALAQAGPAVAQAGPFNPFGEATIDERPGAAIPLDVPFADQNGRQVTLRSLAHGRPMLLVPVLHNCPNFCSVTLVGFAAAATAQKQKLGQDFAMVAFGIDPRDRAADAAGDLQRLAKARGGALPITATTGTGPNIRAVTDALGYHYAWDNRIGQYAHIAAAAVISPSGHLTGWLYGLAPQPTELASALSKAANEDSGTFGERLLLLCYHYDPLTGRYSLAIVRVLQGAGLLSVLLLAGLIVFMQKRHA